MCYKLVRMQKHEVNCFLENIRLDTSYLFLKVENIFLLKEMWVPRVCVLFFY